MFTVNVCWKLHRIFTTFKFAISRPEISSVPKNIPGKIGRQCAPGDALGRLHHPLESLAVVDGAVAVPVIQPDRMFSMVHL